jgi:hypothetical protein
MHDSFPFKLIFRILVLALAKLEILPITEGVTIAFGDRH